MPRIRTIKPIHWNDKELSKLTFGAHLFWIATWNFSDDEGVFENDIYLLISQIFPRRTDIRIEQVSQWIDQLVSARFIIPFVFDNTGYYIHRTFKIHQKIDKPQPSKIPVSVIRRTLHEHSVTIRPCIVGESISKGREGESPPAEFFLEELKTESSQKGYIAAKKFIAPAPEETKEFFKTEPTVPAVWPIEKREAEAGKFFNHYTGNGWRQAGGNPVVDWRAQARKWITKEQEGAFSNGVKKGNSTPVVSKPGQPKIEKDINSLYEIYSKDPDKTTIISMWPDHYEYLFKRGLIGFEEDKLKELEKSAKMYLKGKNLKPDETLLKSTTKKFGELEFFKEQLRQGKEVVFKI